MKTCTKCLEEKSLSDYYPNGKGGLAAACKVCKRTQVLVQQKNDPTYPERHRRAILKHRYGMTPEWYDATLAAQGGHCALCPATVPGGRKQNVYFSVDHDHACCSGRRSCGKCVRGLLCYQCNVSVGWYENHKEAIDNYLAVS